jgi:hypothetical protein
MRIYLPAWRAATQVITLAGLAACAKKDNPAPATPTAVSWVIDGSTVTVTPVTGQVTGTTVQFAASSTSTSIFQGIGFSKLPRAAGTYDISGTTQPGYNGPKGFCLVDNSSYDASLGTITISVLTPTSISGTFAFTGTKLFGTATKVVTGGKFTVSF